MGAYRGFISGQRDKNPDKGQDMSGYIEEWENKWRKMSNFKDHEGIPATLSVISFDGFLAEPL